MRLFFVGLLLTFFAGVNIATAQTTKGFASTYPTAYEGTKTANGEIYNSSEYTARHATLPFNTLVKVTNLKNNKSVTVRINDRFNYKNSRVIDVSNAAASTINLFGDINPQVTIEVVGMADALMFASSPVNDTKAETATTPKTTTKQEEKKETVVAKADVTANADKKINIPKLLPSVKISIPSVSLEEISNIATLSLKYLTTSLFR